MTQYQSVMTADMFGFLVNSSAQRQTVESGLTAAIESYYQEYSDATEVDQEFLDALVLIADTCGSYAEDLLRDVEQDLSDSGRPVHTHTSACDHELED